MMAGTTNKKQTKKSPSKLSHNPDRIQPFIEHLYELRRRLFYVALSIIAWSAAAYAIEQHLIDFLLAPSHGQDFIYTSPIGGINFLFRVCLYVGIAFSIPVIVYQFLRYIEPLFTHSSARFIYIGSVVSAILALGGMAFGYFIGLPTALHFLLHQFSNSHIHALLTIDGYLGFVVVYMLGSALMFQVPLIVLFINRIKPLTPQRLFHYERWVILVSFILAAIMDPTPNVIDQVFIALPIVLTYQLAIGIIWWQHTYSRSHRLRLMLEADRQARQARLEKASHLQPLISPSAPVAHPITTSATISTQHAAPITPRAHRHTRPYTLPRRNYIDMDFVS